jgi:hypothetical protein
MGQDDIHERTEAVIEAEDQADDEELVAELKQDEALVQRLTALRRED